MSLSNGFMMYSFAPACSARAICATSFLVVQKTTLGLEQNRSGHFALTDFERLLAVLGFENLKREAFQLSGDNGKRQWNFDNEACSAARRRFHFDGTPICALLLRTISIPMPRPEMLVTFKAVEKPGAKMRLLISA
jgi:hypothetical protein